MDVRLVVGAGYQLTGIGTESIYTPVPVCEPEMVSDEYGSLNVVASVDGSAPLMGAKRVIPLGQCM